MSGFVLLLAMVCPAQADPTPPDVREPDARDWCLRLRVTSVLPMAGVPLDPLIDFGRLLSEAGVAGRLDPNSIEVVDLATNRPLAHSRDEQFHYGDAGRLQWVVRDPSHTEYEIRFRTTPRHVALKSRTDVPMIGVGDLLRYNAARPRPVTMFYSMRLADVNGDGHRDLLGSWNYAHRPGRPWDGVIVYPGVPGRGGLEFGRMVQLRWVPNAGSDDYRFFPRGYSSADFADLNRDGRLDIVYANIQQDNVRFYLNTGDVDAGGLPLFAGHDGFKKPNPRLFHVRADDINGDGAVDVMLHHDADSYYFRNTNLQGWPVQPAAMERLDAGREPAFYDVDGDGRRDAVCLVGRPAGGGLAGYGVGWRRNLAGDPPRFGPESVLGGIDPLDCTSVAAVNQGERRGLLVAYDVYQRVGFFAQLHRAGEKPRFQFVGDAGSREAVLSLSDQAWPEFCDWDGDGDLDILVGGGYGWPRIVLNEGTCQRPVYAEPKKIFADGRPIRILRDDTLGGSHPHNMGYPYPAYVDWDADGLPDLLLPNETNRIFWYRNDGTRSSPRFGEQRQIVCDGYPDSPEHRAQSVRLAADETVANSPYPHEKTRPFFWRTGAAFADFNGDGLTDLVTHDGWTRKATLFVQYRDAGGKLRLRKDGPLRLVDGRLVDDSIVARSKHWTESFRAVDWDGDRLVDLVYSCAGAHGGIQDGGSIYLLKNVGSRTAPKFENPITMCCFGEPIRITNHGPHPWVGDLDGDGKPDLVACVEWSVYPFYRHAALVMPERPTFRLSPLKRYP